MAMSAATTTSGALVKPKLNFAQIFNMSFGFFGIQFGWDLQRANMGPIYEYVLKASPDQIPLLFLPAAPLTGLIVQPIIGHLSDHNLASPLGTKKTLSFYWCIFKYDLFISYAQQWIALDGCRLVMDTDTSGNIAMEPFRAFVADKLPESTAYKRIRDAKFFDWPGWKHCICLALDHVKSISCAKSFNKGKYSSLGRICFLYRRCDIFYCRDVHDFNE